MRSHPPDEKYERLAAELPANLNPEIVQQLCESTMPTMIFSVTVPLK